jgi:hypothetical protein
MPVVALAVATGFQLRNIPNGNRRYGQNSTIPSAGYCPMKPFHLYLDAFKYPSK